MSKIGSPLRCLRSKNSIAKEISIMAKKDKGGVGATRSSQNLAGKVNKTSKHWEMYLKAISTIQLCLIDGACTMLWMRQLLDTS